MLTTKLDNKTFLIGDKTYSANTPIPLVQAEQQMLGRIVELSGSITTDRVQIMNACYTTKGAYDPLLANTYFQYEQNNREFQYLVSTLMHKICERLGGLLPLRIVTDGNGSVVVREIVNENESTVLTTEIVKKASKYETLVGDIHSMALSTLKDGVNKDDIKCSAANWSLMGAPFVTYPTEALGFPYDFADQYETFKWSDIDGSALDVTMNRVLAGVLGQDRKFEGMKNGTWPLTAMTMIVGEHKTIIINTSELGTDSNRVATAQREVTRLGGKYLILVHFGQIDKTDSIYDYDNDKTNNTQMVGITISISMRSEKADKLLMGAKSWRIIQNAQNISLDICAAFEDNPGVAGANGSIMIADIFKNVTRPKLVAVP